LKIILPKENIVDRTIRYFNPVKAHQRLRARVMLAIAGSYTGASTSRRPLSTWKPKELDADSAILGDLSILRDRSADLLRNSPLAVGAVNTSCTNIVGTGLKLQSRLDRDVIQMSEEEANTWESKTEREWRLWSESQDCDVSRTLPFIYQQELAFRKTLEDGDSFILMTKIKRNGNPYSLALQIVEAARICNADNGRDTPTLAGGIERDESGAPISYHILDQHPGAMLYGKIRTWKKIPAFGEKIGLRNVIHLYKILRPGQSRGVPYLAPVIETLKQLDRYTEAEIMAAVIQSMFTVFIKTEMGETGLAPMIGDQAVDAAAKASDQDLKMASGAIIGLKTGESIETADPSRPNTAFDSFIKAILQQIGVALEIPFEILIGHFSASYSASRAALLEAWRFFKGRRKWLADNLCQIVYENFLWEAVAIGRIAAPGFFNDPLLRKAYCGALWIGDAPSQIDPQKEVDAAEKRLDLALSTLDEETTNLTGGDFETNYPRIKKEREMLKAIGMWPPPGKTLAPGASGSTSKSLMGQEVQE
jgi:lambda family phage portal protein